MPTDKRCLDGTSAERPEYTNKYLGHQMIGKPRPLSKVAIAVAISTTKTMSANSNRSSSYIDVFIYMRDVSIRAEQVEKDFFFKGN
jgi:hypothetical protein